MHWSSPTLTLLMQCLVSMAYPKINQQIQTTENKCIIGAYLLLIYFKNFILLCYEFIPCSIIFWCILWANTSFLLVLDKQLFIFQLAVKPTEKTFKISIANSGICCWWFNGPSFGFMTDKGMDPPRKTYNDVLQINSKPNVNACTCARLECFITEGGLRLTNETLAGSSRFHLAKMEVFHIA